MKTFFDEEADEIMNDTYYLAMKMYHNSNSIISNIIFNPLTSDFDKIFKIKEEIEKINKLDKLLNTSCSHRLGFHYMKSMF